MDRIISFSGGRLLALRVARREEVLRGSTIQGTVSGTHSTAALHTLAPARVERLLIFTSRRSRQIEIQSSGRTIHSYAPSPAFCDVI